MSKIFISHAVADKKLATLLVDFLKEAIGVPTDEIFCSSVAENGIPLGENFNDYMKSRIEAPALVILLMTPSYLESKFCLMELGATWSRSLDRLPIVVKPVAFDEVTRTLGLVQAWDISDQNGLVKLRDKIRHSAISLENRSDSTWDHKREAWRRNLPRILRNSPKSRLVSVAALEEANATVEQANAELQDARAGSARMEAEVVSLKHELVQTRQRLDALLTDVEGVVKDGRRPTFVILEPDSKIATDIHLLLMTNDYVCVGLAGDGAEALVVGERTRPDFLITEVALQSGPTQGLHIARHFQQQWGTVPIFHTRYPERLLTNERPFPAYLVTKPYNATKLILELKKALSEKEKSTAEHDSR
ncbi:TIR domain-containing protein [Rhizobium sp. Root482]|uniref:TIR domain-containing protein n=1 Tax=Rhizobium sp. Root482 TaxID=1736543 RepID=UPI0006FF95D9|nr:TIR domain-containing protein [Rhizobium sp. Root482]KQY14411.1 hypothetical protein ASD31_09080 [Rhizobium sp. Root482]